MYFNLIGDDNTDIYISNSSIDQVGLVLTAEAVAT